MDLQTLEAQIEVFKNNIDPDLADLDLKDFVNAIALTPREQKQAKEFLKQLG